jgi:hypothetical protein
MLDLFDAAGDLSAAIEALHAATALYTAEPVVDVLLDRIGWPDSNGRLVDPSAGDGMFMVRALSRLDLAPDDFQEVARVQGWELHPGAMRSARERVQFHLISNGWSIASAHKAAQAIVHHGDFLTGGPAPGTFRFCAGNPPYLRYGHLPEVLKDLYRPILPDFARGDLLHAFLDRCVYNMPPDGIIGFVTSDRIWVNDTAANLRKQLGHKVGIDHISRLDASSSFYMPKTRRKGTPPRIHPVEVVLTSSAQAKIPLGKLPVSPDGALDQHDGPTLADIATVRLAPWLGPHGIFTIDAHQVARFSDADLLPAVDSDDIDPATDVLRPATRYAIRTHKEKEPTGTVKDHLQATMARMPKRGQKGRWWMPPETITLPLDRPALLIPRIGRKIRTIRLEPGILPINHNLYVVSAGPDHSLEWIQDLLQSDETQAWVLRNAPPLENGYLDIRAGLLRRIPIPGSLSPKTSNVQG